MNSLDHWLELVTMLDATDEDVDDFGVWLQENGEDYWDGKSYDLGEYCMVPVYCVGVNRIVGYSLELNNTGRRDQSKQRKACECGLKNGREYWANPKTIPLKEDSFRLNTIQNKKRCG